MTWNHSYLKDGDTALIAAAEEGRVDIVKIVLLYEVDCNIKNNVEKYFTVINGWINNILQN